MSINYYNILQFHYITEKSTKISEGGRCATFKVFSKHNKRTILKAVEFLFNVKVKSVNAINVKKFITRKSKTRIITKVLNWKKVIVSLRDNFLFDFSRFK